MTDAVPTLRTERLVLRPITPADAPDVARLAGEREVALNTLRIPHPYELPLAEAWIADLAGVVTRQEEMTFAMEQIEDGALIGVIGLVLRARDTHRRAEMGYWVGKPYWGRGYATEAGRAVLGYGFSTGLHRIYASHFARNPASGRVLLKIGMKPEGVLRGHVEKWGEFQDLVMYGILKSEFEGIRK